MSRRILVIEPDAAARRLVDVVLAGLGFAATAIPELDEEATRSLDGEAFELAVVDDSAHAVERLRASHPRLPVIAMCSVTTTHVLVQLLRLGVADVLAKPFTPEELRASVSRTIAQRGALHVEALDFAAATSTARQALVRGDLEIARTAILRARSAHPFDGESMALLALVSELAGRDDEADRGYRAALALRCDEEPAGPDPYEGLARLAAYEDALPVMALDERWAKATARTISDPIHDRAAIDGELVRFPIDLVASPRAATFYRQGARRAFAISVGSSASESTERRPPLRVALR